MKYVGSILMMCFISSAIYAAGEHVEHNDRGERIWHITEYLKGTTAEVVGQLNREVHHFKEAITQATEAIETDGHRLERDRADIVACWLDRPEYKAAKNDAVEKKKQLDQARSAHDSASAMELGSQYNKDREIIERCERAAEKTADDNDIVKGDRERISRDQEQLKEARKGLEKASSWRDNLVLVIRNTSLIQWPLQRHSVGTLGEVIPKKVDANGNVLCSCKIGEDVSAKDAGEGIATVRVRLHPVIILIEGMKVTPDEMNHPMEFDKNIEIVAAGTVEDDEYDAVVKAVVKHADIDDLLDAITQQP